MAPNSCYPCKVMKLICSNECILAPHFPSTNPEIFARLHRIFGGINVYKILSNLESSKREKAVIALCYEAEARERDPISGYYGIFLHYQNHLKNLDEQIKRARSELASIMGPCKVPPYSSLPLPDDFPIEHTTLVSYIDGHGNADASTSVDQSMALRSTNAIRETFPPPQNHMEP